MDGNGFEDQPRNDRRQSRDHQDDNGRGQRREPGSDDIRDYCNLIQHYREDTMSPPAPRPRPRNERHGTRNFTFGTSAFYNESRQYEERRQVIEESPEPLSMRDTNMGPPRAPLSRGRSGDMSMSIPLSATL